MNKRPNQTFRPFLTALLAALVSARSLQAVDVQLLPMQDAMAREAQPSRNFGEAGALAVAGPTSVNGLGLPQGQYQSILQFDASAATTAFDTALGAGNWQLTGATLVVFQIAAPVNEIFNRGSGWIAIHWISDDNWLEGVGTPMDPPVDGGPNEITWNFLQTLVAGSTTSLLATPAIGVQDGPMLIPLNLTGQIADDIEGGGFVSLVASPISPAVGFTFFAMEYPFNPPARPVLVLTALSLVDSDGDLNCDAAVDLLDVQPFALALTDPVAWDDMFPCEIERADVNDDGTVDGRDIAAFVDALIVP